MANKIGTADRAANGGRDGYRLPPGTYVKLLRQQCEQRARREHVHNNPRCSALLDDWRAAAIEREQAGKLAAIEAAETFAELLAAGEPVTAYAWQVHRGGATPGMPAWLITAVRHGGRARVRPDDVCEPGGGRNGAGFAPAAPRHRPAG